eukprot:4792318-Prymnesium_polylepis.1
MAARRRPEEADVMQHGVPSSTVSAVGAPKRSRRPPHGVQAGGEGMSGGGGAVGGGTAGSEGGGGEAGGGEAGGERGGGRRGEREGETGGGKAGPGVGACLEVVLVDARVGIECDRARVVVHDGLRGLADGRRRHAELEPIHFDDKVEPLAQVEVACKRQANLVD